MFDIITQDNCIWCDRVKDLLWRHHKENFVCHNLLKSELKLFAEILHFKTVPQVFHNGKHIGGYENTEQYLIANF